MILITDHLQGLLQMLLLSPGGKSQLLTNILWLMKCHNVTISWQAWYKGFICIWLRHKTDWRLKILESTAHTMLLSCEITAQVLPAPGLDAQPLIITILVGSETDAGNGRERLQSTSDDGNLTRGWQDKYGMLRIAVAVIEHCLNLTVLISLVSQLCPQWTSSRNN